MTENDKHVFFVLAQNGRRLHLPLRETVVLGRGPALQIMDLSVSRQHIKLVALDSQTCQLEVLKPCFVLGRQDKSPRLCPAGHVVEVRFASVCAIPC